MKKFLSLLIIALLMLGMVACAGSPDDPGSDVESGATKTSEMSSYEKLIEINNDFVTDVWNNGLCDISWYVSQGTNSIGGELDFEYTLRHIDKVMERRDESNNYIMSLEGEEYEDIKYIWERLIGTIDSMYATIKAETPRENDSTYEFDTGNFHLYSLDFSDAIYELSEE